MFRNITRISAEEDIRAISVAGAGQSGEGAKSAITQLKEEIGEVARERPVYERKKMQALMNKIAAQDGVRK